MQPPTMPRPTTPTALPPGAMTALLELAAEPMLVIDAQGRVGWCNAAAARSAAPVPGFCELRPEGGDDGRGQSFLQWLRERGVAPEVAPAITEALACGERLEGLWLPRLQAGGRPSRIGWRLSLQPWSDGSSMCRVAVLRPVRRPPEPAAAGSVDAPSANSSAPTPQGPMPPADLGALPEWPTVLAGTGDEAAVDAGATQRLVQSLSETAAQLRLAVELARIGLWRHDLAQGRIYLNAPVFEMLGIAPRPEGLTVAELSEYTHPDDRAAVLDATRELLETGGPIDLETRYRSGDGPWRHVLTRRTLQRSADGAPIAYLGVALDITEQVANARAALDLARRLDLTSAAAGIGLWSQNLRTRQTEWNDHMWRLFGLAREVRAQPFGRWSRMLVHPNDRERVREESRAWVRSRRPTLDTEFRIVRPDGEVRWISNRSRSEITEHGRVLSGVMFDVTERRAAQTALRDAYERAALAARGAGIGTWERDLKHDVALWDEQMYRLRGLDPLDGAVAAPEREGLVHPDDQAVIEAEQRRSIETGTPVTYEFRVRHPDGSFRWLASRTTPVLDEQGRTERLIGVNWDVTDAKNAEAARRDRELALRESQAKSQFLARMSHELRTPLNAVLGFTQLLQAAEDGSSPARQARLAHVRAGGEHLLSLINEVLDLSSLESGQMKLDLQPVEVAAVVREALPLVQQLAQGQRVTVETGGLDGTVLADRTRLRQVLINLLTNAIKYNRPKGRVVVRTDIAGDRLLLHVSDSGRGMTAEQLEHLFEPFNRLGIEDQGIEGTGIGLVIVKVLVERMGGEIAVRSEPEVGSVFELRLRTPSALAPAMPMPMPMSMPMSMATARPASTLGAGAAPAAHASLDADAAATVESSADGDRRVMPRRMSPQRPAPQRGTLLYIEDNPVNTLLVSELVSQRSGLRLVCADDGGTGVARARELQPDLVLVDMQLPDFDGHEVLRRLRADVRTASIPCIALSANAMPADIEHALAAGFSDYWTKPIDLRGFLTALDALFVPAGPAGLQTERAGAA